MFDCCCDPTVEPAAQTAVDALPPITDYGLPVDPYADVVELLQTDPVPTGPAMPIYDPLAPTLADINGQLDAAMTNLIDPFPGYTAQWDSSSNSTDFYEPGRLTPSF